MDCQIYNKIIIFISLNHPRQMGKMLNAARIRLFHHPLPISGSLTKKCCPGSIMTIRPATTADIGDLINENECTWIARRKA
ncbi:hypothetical protein KM92DES2_11074 [uncultured Desulfovibrio sp.]|uniref:Uncharacterized protein n=1 Tax=uncultured Desulfovibrio sp. TaxID=167968 RepID=A0A212JGL1_9BACT|nr:hypothetical protein KM92DES2_11074 [uncultured Desulfovibrio sp.]